MFVVIVVVPRKLITSATRWESDTRSGRVPSPPSRLQDRVLAHGPVCDTAVQIQDSTGPCFQTWIHVRVEGGSEAGLVEFGQLSESRDQDLRVNLDSVERQDGHCIRQKLDPAQGRFASGSPRLRVLIPEELVPRFMCGYGAEFGRCEKIECIYRNQDYGSRMKSQKSLGNIDDLDLVNRLPSQKFKNRPERSNFAGLIGSDRAHMSFFRQCGNEGRTLPDGNWRPANLPQDTFKL